MPSDILAIDFGTSNSAVAVPDGGRPRRIPVEGAADTLPTAVFFPARGGPMRIGEAAGEALIGGEEGRYMRALKSALGTPLLHEPQRVGSQRRTLAQIIAAFLTTLRERAEAATGRSYSRVLSGRPVHFHADPARDAQAEADLRACYHSAGFAEVRFLPEPEAAVLACHHLGAAGAAGLVVDIGGGTSDFSVFRADGGGVRILASHGIRLGGTDFDHALSMTHAMPLLGHGGELRRQTGPGRLPVPNAIYVDLATWAKIPFLYTPATRRQAAQMARLAVAPDRLARLMALLDHELGHELAFAVERGKIAANGTGGARIGMGFIEPGLSAPLGTASLDTALRGCRDDLARAIDESLSLAQVAPGQIGSVILVGGSSLMRMVAEVVQARCPAATLHRSEAFTAVVDGLSLAVTMMEEPARVPMR